MTQPAQKPPGARVEHEHGPPGGFPFGAENRGEGAGVLGEPRGGQACGRGFRCWCCACSAGRESSRAGPCPCPRRCWPGAMMRGRAVPYAAAGCALGALIAGSPAMLLACALLFALYAALRLTNLKPNDLTCVLAAGLSAYLLPLLFAQNLYDHIMAAAGGLTAMVLSHMYATALRVRLQDRELLSPEEIISLSLLLAGVLTGFRQLAPWGDLARARGAAVPVHWAGWLCGAGMGAAVGAVTGPDAGRHAAGGAVSSARHGALGAPAGAVRPAGQMGGRGRPAGGAVLAGAMDAALPHLAARGWKGPWPARGSSACGRARGSACAPSSAARSACGALPP